jgi:hypothetical protein
MSAPTHLLASLATLSFFAFGVPLAAEDAPAPPAPAPLAPPVMAPVAPPNRPPGMQFRGPGMMPGGGNQQQFKVETTIRLIMLDATGAPTPEGQKAIDDLTDDGWRTGTITTISATQPYSIAMVFSRVHARSSMERPMMPPVSAPMQPAPAPGPLAAPAPAPSPAPAK